MLVRFIKRWRNYNGDEIAGFDDAMAEDIIASGFAVLHVEGDEPEAEAGNGLPQQGDDGADTLQAESQRRGGRTKPEPLPLQGAADTQAQGNGADTVTGDQSAT